MTARVKTWWRRLTGRRYTCPVCGAPSTWTTRVGYINTRRSYTACGHTIWWDTKEDSQ